jgi:hypothetical protein
VELYEAWGKPEKAAEWRAKPTTRALGSSSKPYRRPLGLASSRPHL